jgi:hypothetical protein
MIYRYGTSGAGEYWGAGMWTSDFRSPWACAYDCAVNDISLASTPNAITSLSTTYNGGLANSSTDGVANFVNANKCTTTCYTVGTLATGSNSIFYLGAGMDGSTTYYGPSGWQICGFRMYDRVLSQNEITSNYNTDEKRFLAPPVIKLHSKQKNYYSTNVVVTGTDRLEATFPKLHAGKYSVYFRWDGKEYRYPRLCHVTVTNDFNVSGPPQMPGDLKVTIGKKKQ